MNLITFSLAAIKSMHLLYL